MSEDFNLPHWTIRDELPSAKGEAKGFDRALSSRTNEIHENFEAFVFQTAERFRDLSVQPPEEALGEVTTTSGSFVSLSGGPEITVACRAGLMVAVLMDVELKNSAGNTSLVVAELDGSGAYAAGISDSDVAYQRFLSAPDLAGAAYPAGVLAVFPATATSHTIEMKYRVSSGGDTGSFKNRRLWAWVL